MFQERIIGAIVLNAIGIFERSFEIRDGVQDFVFLGADLNRINAKRQVDEEHAEQPS